MPTEAGKRLLAHARGILQQVERARAEVDEIKGAPVGHIVVGLPPTLARLMTAPVVREFRRRFPRASLSIVEGLSSYIHEWLQVGRDRHRPPLQSGALAGDRQPAAVRGGALLRRPRGRKAAAPRALPLRELPRYPLIIPSRPNAIRMLVETRLAALGSKPQVAMEIDAVAAILELVAEGHGLRRTVAAGAARAPTSRAGSSRGRSCSRGLRARSRSPTSAQRPSTPLQTASVGLITELVPVALGPS